MEKGFGNGAAKLDQSLSPIFLKDIGGLVLQEGAEFERSCFAGGPLCRLVVSVGVLRQGALSRMQ